FLTDVIKEMGIDVSVKTFTNDKMVYIDVDGPDSGTVIGKRGSTLDALQYLTSLVVNKGESGYTRVVINAEGYREKREKTLEKLANRLADKAVRTGKSVRLEPMNPYERKVIHTVLQARPEVRTRSEGEEPYRKVVIEAVRK
ncbi:MAG: RNA-binding cell elongation regulator Jag/EloR, partial [Bacillota bacterium]|nr:RNA-binding cell elongation regulator Jag/EloR [Bacillota bacterium]